MAAVRPPCTAVRPPCDRRATAVRPPFGSGCISRSPASRGADPFPSFRNASFTTCNATPVSESLLLGEWFSMPAAAECRPSTRAFPGPDGCSWARRATQHFVRGFELLGLGFNTSRPYDAAQLRQNDEVIERAFARHPRRCCDC